MGCRHDVVFSNESGVYLVYIRLGLGQEGQYVDKGFGVPELSVEEQGISILSIAHIKAYDSIGCENIYKNGYYQVCILSLLYRKHHSRNNSVLDMQELTYCALLQIIMFLKVR